MKIALISCISVICVAAIILGCVLGIKKKNLHSTIPTVGFTDSQKLLADEINKNSVLNSYELQPIDGAPYLSNDISYDDIVVFGANYFIAEKLDGFHFYVFNKNSEGKFVSKDLTELYGKKDSLLIKYLMPVYNDEYVFIISDYDSEGFADGELQYTCAYYSLIYFGDFEILGDEKAEVFNFDATDGAGFIEPITLKENYFIINYQNDRGANGFVSDFYYYELNNIKVNTNNQNKISTFYYDDIGITVNGNDNCFYIVDGECVYLVYLTKHGFEKIVYENVFVDEKISIKFNAYILSDHKFLIEKTKYTLNNSELTNSSIKVSDGSNQIFINNTYLIYDFLPETPIQIDYKLNEGFGAATTGNNNALEESYYICQQKVNNNLLVDEFESSYYNKENDKIVSYNSAKWEMIIRAGTNTLLTNLRLLRIYHNDKVEEIVKFSDETYNLVTSGASASGVDSDVFAITKDGFWGAMNIDGEILINPEDHIYVKDNGMIAPIVNGVSIISKQTDMQGVKEVYLFDANNKNNNYVTPLNSFLMNDYLVPVINAGFIVYVTGEEEGLKTIKIFGHEKNLTYEIKKYEIKGMKVGQCLELIDKDDNYIVVYAEKLTTIYGNKDDAEQIEMNNYAIDNYVSSTTNGWTFWASDTWGDHDFSITLGDYPSVYYINSATANLTFANTFDFKITSTSISDYMGLSATYSYSGGINSFNVTWKDNKVYYSGQFSYTWTGVKINSWSVSDSEIYQYLFYYYNMSPYSSSSNQISNTSLVNTDLAILVNYKSTLEEVPITLPSYDVTGGYVSSWYYSDTSQSRNASSISSLSYAGSSGSQYTLSKEQRYYYFYGYIAPYSYKLDLDNQNATDEGTSAIYQTYNVCYRSNPYYGTITNITCPSKIGYRFLGYYTSTNGNGEQVINIGGSILKSNTYFTRDTTLYAYWTPNSYSVSYDFNYGISGTSAPSYMYYDTTYTISNPSRTGYVFTGWSITGMSSDCEKVLGGTTYPASTTTKSGITGTSFKNMRSIDGYVYLTANWSVTTYYINYVYNNNGDNPTDYSNPTSAVYDTTFMVKNPVRRGYTFAGWTASNINTSTAKYGSSSGLCNTSWNGTNKVYYSAGTYFKNLNSTSGNVTLTANWTSNQYNIEYILNGGTTGGSMVNYAYYDSVFYVPNPIRTGYRFTGWKITGMNISDNVTNKPITHYYGTDSSTTLSFNGATFSPSSIYTYFKNLNSDKGAKVTFTAIWNANNFNINYNYNDGKSGGISPIVGIFDTDLKISNPIKTGYTFVSWSISGMDNTAHSYGETIMTYQTTTDTSITFTPTTKETWYKNLTAVHDATITFTANWSANTYNINFETNGSYNSYVDITATYKYPMPTSISDSNWTTIVNPVKTGYTFTGWSFSGYNAKDFNSNESYNIYFVQDGLIKSFSSTNQNIIFPVGVEKFMNLCSNVNNYVTFTANWSANVYNITYDVGAGTADLSNPTSAIYDQWFTINRPTTIPFGYYFAGWIVTLMNETDETTGETVIHFAGKSTVFTTTQTGNIFRYETDSDVTYFKNLYSNTNGTILITTIWNPNTYYLKYNLSDSLGSGYFESDALNPTEAKFNNKFTVSDPSRKGYTFMGWTLKDLTDDCEHYYYQDSNEIKFTTTNGKYLDPENVNNYIVVKASQFMNLRSNSETTEDAVTLTATWKANNYTVSYHYLPSNFDTSILGMGALNMATNMTAVKNQTVTYDKEFLTFKSANSDDETSIILPLNVKLVYWAFYDTVKDSLIAILDASGEISGVNSDYYFAQGSQAIFNFYGSDVHAYAVYKFTEITIKYLAPSSSAGLNDISTYEVVNTGKAQNYAQFTLSYVPAESSDKFIGWMLSANKYIDGYLTAESITQFTYNDIVYSTAKDSTIIWAYNSSSTAHIDEPTYYLYAVYNYTRPYSSTFVSSGDSYQNNAFYDEICLDEDLVEYVDELNNNMIFDNKN